MINEIKSTCFPRRHVQGYSSQHWEQTKCPSYTSSSVNGRPENPKGTALQLERIRCVRTEKERERERGLQVTLLSDKNNWQNEAMPFTYHSSPVNKVMADVSKCSCTSTLVRRQQTEKLSLGHKEGPGIQARHKTLESFMKCSGIAY